MKITSFFVLCFLEASLAFGQANVKLDSLKQELAKAKDDTAKVLIYAQLVDFRLPVPFAEKIKFGQSGFDLAKKIHFDKGIILCGNNLGFILVEKDYFKALPILFDVKQICERNKDTVNLVRAIGFIGYAHGKFNVPKSIYYYRICLNLMQKAHVSERVIPIYTAMGYAFKDNGDLDSALIYLKKGYQSSLAGISPIGINNYDKHFGEIYYKKGNIALAKLYLKKSIAHANEGTFGEANYFLALIFRDKNQLDSAKYCAKQAFVFDQKQERNIYLIRSSELLYELYKNSDTKAALNYLEIASATKDSLFNQEKARQVEKLAFEERERERLAQRRIEARQSEFRNQAIIYTLLGNLIGALIFAYFLYKKNRQKHKTNQVLEKTLSQLKTTQAQLIQSEKLASLGELTAGIAHEIQNPLNFVNNFSEVSNELLAELKGPLTPEGGILAGQKIDMEVISDLEKNIEKITLHGKRASSIIKGMLEHSRTSTGEKEITDINALADEYLRLAYHGLGAKDKNFNADFKTDLDPNLPKVMVIPQDVGRVLLNLINNAFQSPLPAAADRPNGGAKLVVVKTLYVNEANSPIGGRGAVISVSDNGSGMSPEIKSKIFQPFFTTKPTGQGTGLGLSLAYDIVTKGHGGTIECESVEGVGTVFIVKLPIV